MTSWEWAEENPVMNERQLERFLAAHDLDPDFRAECEAFRVAGGYDSAAVIGLAGY